MKMNNFDIPENHVCCVEKASEYNGSLSKQGWSVLGVFMDKETDGALYGVFIRHVEDVIGELEREKAESLQKVWKLEGDLKKAQEKNCELLEKLEEARKEAE